MTKTGPPRSTIRREVPVSAGRPPYRPPPSRTGARHAPKLISAITLPVSTPPVIGLACTGLLLQVTGYALGWAEQPGSLLLFYLGLVLIGVPCAGLLLGVTATRRQRLVTVVALAVLLYLSFYLSSPLFPIRFDETLHVASLRTLLRTHSLFDPNTMLPISPYYPGLELTAAGIRWLTGLPMTACEFLVVLLSRLVLILGLFHIGERCARSARVGGIAALLYTCSAQFYFFNAQFAYQTMAIALTLGLIWLTQSAVDSSRPRLWLGLALADAAALTITHHVTSWITLSAMALWSFTLLRGAQRTRRIVGGVTVAYGVMIVAWTLAVGSRLTGYLYPLFDSAQIQIRSILSGSGHSRKLLSSNTGTRTPLWEEGALIGSLLIWLVLISLAGWATLRGRHVLGQGRLVWLAVATSSTFPLLLGARLSPVASSIADRASTFIFFPIVVVVAAWLVGQLHRVRPVVALAAFAVLLVGGTILGSGPDWQRVPGQYLVAAQQRSLDAADLGAARWAADHLPAGSRIAADFTLQSFLPDLAPITSVTAIGGGTNVAPLYYDDTISGSDQFLIRQARIDFVFVDTRMANQPPQAGAYFEPDSRFDGRLITTTELQKFEGAPGFVKVFDGPVRIYDVRGIAGAAVRTTPPSSAADPQRLHGTQVIVFGVLALSLLALLGDARLRSTQLLAGLLGGLASLLALGLVGAATGFGSTSGSVVLVIVGVVLAGVLSQAGPRLRAPLGRPDAASTANVVTAVLIVALCAALAFISAHDALDPTPPVGAAVRGALL